MGNTKVKPTNDPRGWASRLQTFMDRWIPRRSVSTTHDKFLEEVEELRLALSTDRMQLYMDLEDIWKGTERMSLTDKKDFQDLRNDPRTQQDIAHALGELADVSILCDDLALLLGTGLHSVKEDKLVELDRRREAGTWPKKQITE